MIKTTVVNLRQMENETHNQTIYMYTK